MNFISRIANELLFFGHEKSVFLSVKNSIDERNRESLVAWSICAGLFWVVGLMLSLWLDEYVVCRAVYASALASCIFTFVCASFFVRRFPKLLFPVMCLFGLSILCAGIGMAMVRPGTRSSTMIAFAIITPTCFIERTMFSVALEMVSITGYAVLGSAIVHPDVFSWGILNLPIFSIAGVIIGHIINRDRFERYLFADSAKRLADIQKDFSKRLQKEVAVKTERLVALQNQLIIGLATMVESRDSLTGGHITRTSAGVRILLDEIAKGEGLPEDFCEDLTKAAPMHDIGKIAVDDAILRKPGVYTPEEYNQMKVHAAAGAKILHEILRESDDEQFRRIAENVAHYHHERMDGSGYPEGLKGDEIPLESRIMAIADVYDALVSRRVYKESFSFEDADKIILKGMGTQFDPKLRKYYEAARPRLEEYYRARSNKD